MSGYINKNEFLAALAGIPVDYVVEGIGTIKIRGLSVLESNELNRKHNGDGSAIVCDAITMCVIEPQLGPSDVEAIRRGLPGFVQNLGDKIMTLSGLRPDEDLEKKVGPGS